MRLRGERFVISDLSLEGEREFQRTRGGAVEIRLVASLRGASEVGLKLGCSPDGGTAVSIAFDGQRLQIGDLTVPYSPAGGLRTLDLRVFVDRSVLEVYAGGRTCITRVVKTAAGQEGMAIWAKGGSAKIESLESWPISSIWAAGSRP
jgi:beta-fructofuranosidase